MTKVYVKDDRIEFVGHQDTIDLCAGLSGLIVAYATYTEKYKHEPNDRREFDKFTIYDDGTNAYQMILYAMRHMADVYKLQIKENNEEL